MDNQLTVIPDQGAFAGPANFEHAQRVAKMLSSSSLIPKDFQNNIQNTMIALEMANRINASPLMVMQNLYIVHGKPSFSSTFIIGAINASGRFTTLLFDVTGEGDQKGCIAYATDIKSDTRVESPRVTIEMAKKEGWFGKTGSKWQTMPDLMMRYRAASFFGRLNCPDILMGFQSYEEVLDVKPEIAQDYDSQFEQLESLFQEKLELIPDDDLPNIKRIIEEKETKSFKKAFTLLNSLSNAE